MSKARQLADNGAASPNRNILINGAMNVAQRATSVTGLGANATPSYSTVDRFGVFSLGSSAGRYTMTQETITDLPGFAKCMKLACTTADDDIGAGEFLVPTQIVEGQNLFRTAKGTSGALPWTISFYVKANAAFNYILDVYENDSSRLTSRLFATTTSWVRHEFTIPADTANGTITNDNTASLYLGIILHAGSNFKSGTLNQTGWGDIATANRASDAISSFYSSTNNTFFLTGFQLEVGEAATPFEHEDYNTTLQKCLRYYENNCDRGHFPAHDIAFGNTNSPFFMHGFLADNMRMNHAYTVEKRADPTATFHTVTGLGNGATENRWDFWTGNAWNQCDGNTVSSEITSKGLIITQTEADLVLDRSYMVGGCFELDAEL